MGAPLKKTKFGRPIGQRCEVITCGRTGPRQCTEKGGNIVDDYEDKPRVVCSFHRKQPHLWAFTKGQAIQAKRLREAFANSRRRDHATAQVRDRPDSSV